MSKMESAVSVLCLRVDFLRESIRYQVLRDEKMVFSAFQSRR
jgi:hypothetical protein